MYKKIAYMLLFGFLIIGAASAYDFKLNDGFIKLPRLVEAVDL